MRARCFCASTQQLDVWRAKLEALALCVERLPRRTLATGNALARETAMIVMVLRTYSLSIVFIIDCTAVSSLERFQNSANYITTHKIKIEVYKVDNTRNSSVMTIKTLLDKFHFVGTSILVRSSIRFQRSRSQRNLDSKVRDEVRDHPQSAKISHLNNNNNENTIAVCTLSTAQKLR